MTQDSPNIMTLLKIPGSVFIESPNAYQTISFLTERLNTGYDRMKFKYGVIKSARIKNETAFLNDLGIYATGSFMWILIVDKDNYTTAVSDALKDGKLDSKEARTDLSLKHISQEQILGTIGVKPKIEGDVQGWEITGFTSFQKGVGKFLMRTIEKIAVDEKVKFLFASVICEHELVPYYAQYGFKETGKRHILEIDETGKVKGDALEDGIHASQTFHVAELKKEL